MLVPDGTYSDGRPGHLEVYVDPSFKNVLAPWGPNLLSDGDFSQSVPSNGAANGWTSTNIDGNGGWFPDYFILNSNGSASTDPTISQSLTNVNPGVTYQITGYVTNVYPQYGGSSSNAFEIAVNGQVVLAKSKAQANGWVFFTTTWTDVNTTTATLSLIGEHGDDSSFAITDIAFQAQNTPAYVTDWAHGTDLCIDGSGREVACPAGPTGGLRPSIIPVYATQLTPFVRTADVVSSSLPNGGAALSGHDTLDIEASNTSGATTTVETYTVPVDQLSGGQPVLNSDGLPNTYSPTAKTYFGGEPVLDPLTGEQLYYSGGEPVLDVFTGQQVKDPNGTVLTHPTCTDTVNHVGCDPMLHIAGDPVVQARGSVVDYLGGEQVFDENGNPVYTGSQPFTYSAGQAQIVDRGQTVYKLEQNDGSLVAISDTNFTAPSFTLTSLAGKVLTLTGGVTIASGDLVSVLVYDGTDIYTLPSGEFTTSAGSVTIGGGVTTKCTTTGCVTVKLVIQRAAVHGATDVKLYNGSEPVAAGQPVLDAGNSLQYDASGHIVVYQPSQTTQSVREAFYWIPSGGTMTIHAEPVGCDDLEPPDRRRDDDDRHVALHAERLDAAHHADRPLTTGSSAAHDHVHRRGAPLARRAGLQRLQRHPHVEHVRRADVRARLAPSSRSAASRCSTPAASRRTTRPPTRC